MEDDVDALFERLWGAFDKNLADGQIQCSRCGVVLTPYTIGHTRLSGDYRGGTVTNTEAFCRDRTIIATWHPES